MPGRELNLQATVEGLTEVRMALRGFGPDVSRRLTLQVRNGAATIAAGARGRFPQGQTGDGRAGFRVERIPTRSGPRGFSGGYRVVNRTREGVILEHAGSTTSGRTGQGKSLIRGLDARYGPPGRFLWRSVDERMGMVRVRLEAAVQQAERDLQARIDAAASTRG